MKIKSLVYLALFGLVCSQETDPTAEADPAAAEGETATESEAVTEPKVAQLPVDTVEVEDCSIIEDVETRVACKAVPIPWYHNGDQAKLAEDERATNFPIVDVSADGAMIIGASFDLQSCAGFRQEGLDLIYSARTNDCLTTRSATPTGRQDVTSALALTDFEKICTQITAIDLQPRPYDVLLVSFNFPVQYDTLKITGDNFIITTSDGNFVRPKCAILDPALEGNEMNTVHLIGHFGGRTFETSPLQVRVIGDLKLRDYKNGKNIAAAGLKLDRDNGSSDWEMGMTQYGHGLSYESGLVMLQAKMYPMSKKGEATEADEANHCQVNFPSTKYVIKVLFNGAPTLDGYHCLNPTRDIRFFSVVKSREIIGPSSGKFKGLADLGVLEDVWWKNFTQSMDQQYTSDGDNYVDLCLDIEEGEANDIKAILIQQGAVLPPRGSGPNIEHMVQVELVTDGTYPYALTATPMAEKLYDLYVEEVVDIVAIAGSAGSGVILIPILGFLFGIGMMFLQSFVRV